DQVRGLRAGDQHGTDNQVSRTEAVEDVVAITEDGGDVGRHHVVKVTKAVEIDVEDGDVRPQPGCHLGCVGADDTSTEDGHVRWLHAGDAAEQDTAAIER